MEPLPWLRIIAPVLACLALGAVAVAGNTRFRFAGLGVVAAVAYGILQDQVSARLCLEYFTLFHNPIPGVTDPTVLGLAWGFLGTWWAGLFLGYCSGLIATLGSAPKLTPRDIIRPLLALMTGIAGAVVLTGVSVWWNARSLEVSLDPALGSMLPAERHQALLVVACYHMTGYFAAFGGSLVLWVWIWRERRRRAMLGYVRFPERISVEGKTNTILSGLGPHNIPRQIDTA
jgi:hypothetical protein